MGTSRLVKRLLRALDAWRRSQSGESNAWDVRKLIRGTLQHAGVSDTARRVASCALFRQTRSAAFGNEPPLALACRQVLAGYLRFSDSPVWSFTLVASLERSGFVYTYADESLAVLSMLRCAAGSGQGITTDKKEDDLMSRMNGMIEELGKAAPFVVLYASSFEEMIAPLTLDQALSLYRESEERLNLIDCWKVVCMAKQIGLDVHLNAFVRRFDSQYLLALSVLMEERRMDRTAFAQFNAAHTELLKLGVQGSIHVTRAWDEAARCIPLQDFARDAHRIATS